MREQNSESRLIVIIIATAAFFLILAVFGKSQAADLLTPNTREELQISSKSPDSLVTINTDSAKTEIYQPPEAVYSFEVPHQISLSELNSWIDGHDFIVWDDDLSLLLGW